MKEYFFLYKGLRPIAWVCIYDYLHLKKNLWSPWFIKKNWSAFRVIKRGVSCVPLTTMHEAVTLSGPLIFVIFLKKGPVLNSSMNTNMNKNLVTLVVRM